MIAGEGKRSRHVALPTVPVADLATTHMTRSSSGVVLSSLTSPFIWKSVSTAGRTLIWGRPFPTEARIEEISGSAARSSFLGLAAYEIDEGFIQLLADPRSDLRVISVYGPDAKVISQTSLRVSLGFLDFERETNHLLALRRTDGLELVTYRLMRTSP